MTRKTLGFWVVGIMIAYNVRIGEHEYTDKLNSASSTICLNWSFENMARLNDTNVVKLASTTSNVTRCIIRHLLLRLLIMTTHAISMSNVIGYLWCLALYTLIKVSSILLNE